MTEIKKVFRPEFLNRVDDIIVFKSLTESEIEQIVDLMVADLRDRLIAQNMSINLSEAARKYIAQQGTDTQFGARPLRRAIQRLLEDVISEQILEGRWKPKSIINVDYDGKKLTFRKGRGEVPQARKRQSMRREVELVTPFFKNSDQQGTNDSSLQE